MRGMKKSSPAAAKAVVQAVAAKDLAKLRRALEKFDSELPPAAMVKAGQLAWLPGLKLLVTHGGDLNATFRNYRPLHALIQEELHHVTDVTSVRVKCMQWMLAHGADPELAAAWPSARALVIAAFQGQPDYVRALREHGAKIDIFTAAALGDAKRVGKLVAADSTLARARDHERLTALQCAAGSRMGAKTSRVATGLLEGARLLVDAGADVNASTPSWGHEPSVSYFVIRSGQIEMLRYLLSRGLNATEAVSTAAWEHREEILDMLIAHGAGLNRALDRGRPVLNELVRWGQFKQARMYLSKGASPNLRDDRGWTAMHQVVSRGNVKMLQDLLAAGGDPAVAAADGKTPRGMAKSSGKPALLAAIDGR
jgi:ankyrin repeat protein